MPAGTGRRYSQVSEQQGMRRALVSRHGAPPGEPWHAKGQAPFQSTEADV